MKSCQDFENKKTDGQTARQLSIFIFLHTPSKISKHQPHNHNTNSKNSCVFQHRLSNIDQKFWRYKDQNTFDQSKPTNNCHNNCPIFHPNIVSIHNQESHNQRNHPSKIHKSRTFQHLSERLFVVRTVEQKTKSK